MSPEYNFYIKANLPGPKEAGELVVRLYETPGVEVVQLHAANATGILLSSEEMQSRGLLLRGARVSAGFTQEVLAQRARCSKAMISLIEAGKHPGSIDLLTRVVGELGFTDEDPRRGQLLSGGIPGGRVRSGRTGPVSQG